MPTAIYNEPKFIRIVRSTGTIVVNKTQIKTIDTKSNTVRLDIGEGALKHIYLHVTEIDTPKVFAHAEDLRDYLLSLWDANNSGLATEVKQNDTIGKLVEMHRTLIAINDSIVQKSGDTGLNDPLRIDESTPEVVYYGYAAANTPTPEARWAIKKATRVRDEIVYEWADGNQSFDNIWDERYSLQYYPSGFN